jgi:hypothetical protein
MGEPSTAPKPFAFVLMPFDAKFDDIYKFGIKGAADDAGAYAERIDEQIFIEEMLERIFNQINKADVIIADMTGKNPNVFYEVGYAHALNKVVLLVTQSAEDIPFDLKHRQHIVYGGKIDQLRTELTSRISWGVMEAERRRMSQATEKISVRLNGVELSVGHDASITKEVRVEAQQVITQTVEGPMWGNSLLLQVRNNSERGVLTISYVYLFGEQNARIVPAIAKGRDYIIGGDSSSLGFIDSMVADPVDAPDSLKMQFPLPIKFESLPPHTTERHPFHVGSHESDCSSVFRLRLHTQSSYFDLPFRISLRRPLPSDSVAGKTQEER